MDTYFPAPDREASKLIPRINQDCRTEGRKSQICLLFSLTDQSLFVFYGGATAAGIPLNDEKFGMLYGKHIRRQIRRRAGLRCLFWIPYGLRAKWCYADGRALVCSYLETIYT